MHHLLIPTKSTRVACEGENPIHEPKTFGPSHAMRKATSWQNRLHAESKAWAHKTVDRFPVSWVSRLLGRWAQRSALDCAAANLDLLNQSKAIAAAQKMGIPADANDSDIRQHAKDTARDMARRLDQRQVITNSYMPLAVSQWSRDWTKRACLMAQLAEAMHWLEQRGVMLSLRSASIETVLKRVVCERFWRRVIRRVHAQAVETVARRIGLVHKRAGCYVSDDALQRRTGQIARNIAALESVDAINENGQTYTLAELAAKGVANKEIRRHELMTRIAGFELIAKECSHEAFFVTVTCPSRMHAYRKKGQWFTEPNPKHDGTTVDQAQAYLTKQWSLCRSSADRAGLQWYGFRIAEPNHDGTPHWHMLLFVQPVRSFFNRPRMRHWDAGCMLGAKLARYFLFNDSRNERGARDSRIDFERIDWTKGSAAGYVAKYVSKNIDGYKVEKDLHGNDCMTASKRVDAWASTWRIRQFQQVGGPPVTTWRELRRLHPENMSAAVAVSEGLRAVNQATQQKQAQSEEVERYTAANGWGDYVRLQGGPRVPRRMLNLRVLREQTGEVGRYGELMAPRAVGVVASEFVPAQYIKPFGILLSGMVLPAKMQRVEVESERSTWTIAPRALAQAQAEGLRPRSPVNNCTDSTYPQGEGLIGEGAYSVIAVLAKRPPPMFEHEPDVRRVKKRGQVFRWADRQGQTQAN